MGTTALLVDITAATMAILESGMAAPGTASLAGMEVSVTALGIASLATMGGIAVGTIVAFRVVGILGVDIMLGVGEERKLWCKRRMELGVPWDRLDLGGLRVLVIGWVIRGGVVGVGIASRGFWLWV